MQIVQHHWWWKCLSFSNYKCIHPHSIFHRAGLDDSWTLLPYGKRLREFHTLGRRTMTPQAAKAYDPILEDEAQLFAKSLLQGPDQLWEHVHRYCDIFIYGTWTNSSEDRFTSDIMLRLLYGYTPSPELDHLSRISRKLGQDCAVLFTASSQLLDLFPVCRLLQRLL